MLAVALGELNGQPIALTGSDDRTLRVYDLASGTERADLAGHTGPVRAVAFGQLDSHPIALTGSDDRTVHVWDLTSAVPLYDPLSGHNGPVRAVAFGELDGEPIALTGSDDGTLRMWNLTAGTNVASRSPPTTPASWRWRLAS